jgi:hypothetical protein
MAVRFQGGKAVPVNPQAKSVFREWAINKFDPAYQGFFRVMTEAEGSIPDADLQRIQKALASALTTVQKVANR